MGFNQHGGASGEVEWNKGQSNSVATLKWREPASGRSKESMVGTARGGFSHELAFKQ